MDALIQNYNKYGYCVLDAFTPSEFIELKNFTKKWVISLINSENKVNIDNYDLSKYHQWFSEKKIEHDGLFKAKNRYIDPPENIKNITHNNKVIALLDKLIQGGYTQWSDPGLDWFGFRLIRPNMGDGYPTSCKNWGAAAGVVSIWLPIIGFSELETLSFVPGSHIKEYQNYLPDNHKFTKGELRLSEKIDENEYKRLNLNEGQIIVYHPALLHSENVEKGDTTRINLEYRFMPIK